MRLKYDLALGLCIQLLVANLCNTLLLHIGGGSRGPWPLLNFKALHRNSILAIENHLSLVKWPP